MRKIICLIMTMLLFCATCVPVMAETQEIEGSGITWELTDNDTTLTISGTGDMPDFQIPLYLPWHSVANTITTVIINPGVTSIGNSSFMCCRSLQSITIPSSVKSIGVRAFQDCMNLQSITIPSSVTSIGSDAFTNCSSLKTLTFKSIAPPSCHGAVRLSPITAVYVPYGAAAAYRANIAWDAATENSISEAYMVDILPAQHGTIIASKDFFAASKYKEASETVTIDAIPDEGYQLKSLTYSDAETTTDITEEMSFTMPCDNVTLTAEFELVEADTASIIANGNLTIIVSIAAAAVIAIAAIVILKKKQNV